MLINSGIDVVGITIFSGKSKGGGNKEDCYPGPEERGGPKLRPH